MYFVGQKFAIHEEKTILASIIKKFKIKSMETPQEKKLFAHVILRPQDGINITVKERDGERC